MSQQKSETLDRLYSFAGVYNFRDIGGYPTTDGGRVRRGMLFRSAELNGMTEEDIREFAALNIQVVFDYRDTSEAEEKPNPELPHIHYERLSSEHAASRSVAFQVDSDELLHKIPDHFNEEVFAGFYGKLPLQNAAYRRLFELLLDEKRPRILQHCKIGKDRTGVGVALVHLALGVERRYIIGDYLLSEELLRPLKDNIIMRQRWNVHEAKKIDVVMSARVEYIEAALDAVERYEGGSQAYFEQELGMTAKKLKLLRKIYVDSV